MLHADGTPMAVCVGILSLQVYCGTAATCGSSHPHITAWTQLSAAHFTFSTGILCVLMTVRVTVVLWSMGFASLLCGATAA